MRIALKTLVVILACALGVAMGIYLLDGFIIWKILIWALLCKIAGHVVYRLLRVIDKKYGDVTQSVGVRMEKG